MTTTVLHKNIENSSFSIDEGRDIVLYDRGGGL